MSARSQHPLTPLFEPRSIALIGASDRSQWSSMAMRTATGLGYSGKLYPVNKRGVPAHGLPGVTSCTLIPDKVDCAFIFVPQEAVVDAVKDAAAAGIKHAVIMTSGYTEAGLEGAALERELAATADAVGLRFIGPNTLGILNYSNRSAVGTLPPNIPIIEGRVSVVAQSGAMASFLSTFAHQQGIGINQLIATGNEAQIGVGECVDYLVEDETTNAIVVYAQTIRDTERFVAAAERALAKKKPIVVLKIGASELAAKVALTHTGAVVGDAKVFEAVCDQLGVMRARSIEDVISTAALAAHTGVLRKPGIGFVSISGGAAELIAERAEIVGLDIPAFAPETIAALREVLPTYAATHNPIDITGAAVRDPSLWVKTCEVVSRDPAVGLVAAVSDAPSTESQNSNEANSVAVGNAISGIDLPGILLTSFFRPHTEYMREFQERTHLPFVLDSVFGGVDALAKVVRWSAAASKPRVRPAPPPLTTRARPHSERETLDYLHSFGVPVIPATLAKSVDDARAAALRLNGPVALKIASPDIAHKTEVGGVKLNLQGPDAVAAGFEAMMATVRRKAPNAKLDGVVVSPMRTSGLELFVGIKRDAQWGLVLAVGLGGVWIEVLKDTAVRVLPVAKDDVLEMFASLKAAKLLRGYRGSAGVDLDALADVTLKVAEAAMALGPELEGLEINPLLANGGAIEALDALAVYATR